MLSYGDLLILVVSFFGLFTSIFFLLTLFENKNKLKNPKSSKFPKVTIFVPVYNAEKTIQKTVNSLLSLDYPKEKLEIIIINDGSIDNTLKEAKKFQKHNIRVLSKKNEGKGKALNFGLKYATGEFCGVLDADSFVESSALKKMLGYFDDPDVMAVTPSLKVYKPNKLLQKIQQIEYFLGILLRKVFALLGSIHVTPGPFTIYRKKFFDRFGGYDEENATEDIEIALRIQTKNYKIENSIDACVYTVAPKKFVPLLNQRIRWYRGFIDNVFNKKYIKLFGKKHGNLGIFILPISFLSVILVILSIAYVVYKLTDNIYISIINFYNSGFDLKNLFSFNLDLFLVNLNPIAIISIIGLISSIILILIAKSLSNEEESILIAYLYFMFAYSWLYAFWWLCAIYYKLFNKKILWGKRWV